jgi:uncharacterized protein (DUF2249 family)
MKREITLQTKIADLLNDYENMKEILIEINPKFKKLNNPVLRRTVAKVAGVKQAAIVGGMDPYELLNRLRIAVGQEPIEIKSETETKIKDEPDWIKKSDPKAVLDANELLEKEKNPLAEANKILKTFDKDDVLTIIADFRPEPLIEEFEKKGFEVYCKEVEKDSFVTFIKC